MMLLRYHYIYELELPIFIIWTVIIWPAASRVLYPEPQQSANGPLGQGFDTNSQDAGAALHNERSLSYIYNLEPKFVPRIRRRNGKPAMRSNSEDPSVSNRARSQMLYILSKMDDPNYESAQVRGAGDGAHKIESRDSKGRKHDRDDTDDAADNDKERDTKKIKIEEDEAEEPANEDSGRDTKNIKLEFEVGDPTDVDSEQDKKKIKPEDDDFEDEFEIKEYELGEGYDYCRYQYVPLEVGNVGEQTGRGQWQDQLRGLICSDRRLFNIMAQYLSVSVMSYPSFYPVAIEKGTVWALALSTAVIEGYLSYKDQLGMWRWFERRYIWEVKRFDYDIDESHLSGKPASHVIEALLELGDIPVKTPLSRMLTEIGKRWVVLETNKRKKWKTIPYFDISLRLPPEIQAALERERPIDSGSMPEKEELPLVPRVLCNPFGFHNFPYSGLAGKTSDTLIAFWQACRTGLHETHTGSRKTQPFWISHNRVQIKSNGLLAFVWKTLLPHSPPGHKSSPPYITVRQPEKPYQEPPRRTLFDFWDEYIAFRVLMSTDEAISVTEMLVETREILGVKEISSFNFGYDRGSQQWHLVIITSDFIL